MKKIAAISMIIMALAACSTAPNKSLTTADVNASVETQALMALLQKNLQKGIMFGHQDDMSYGRAWSYPNGESDVKRVCSDYPAVTGMDLGHIELGDTENLDSVPFKDMIEMAQKVNAYGGIITISWHQNNPLTDSTAWDNTSDKVVASIIPGGANHDKYVQWLDKVAAFLGSLKDENGNLIPVIFRPYHEHTGNWFWWGQKLCTPSEFKTMWQFTFDYLTKTKNLHNLLFAYSSSGDFNNSGEYLEKYPGDQYVDILGFDYYQFNDSGKQTFIDEVSKKLGILTAIAREHKKIPALTEAGYESLPDSTWWTGVMWPAIKDHKISWFLVWRNAQYRIDHFYAPYPGSEK